VFVPAYNCKNQLLRVIKKIESNVNLKSIPFIIVDNVSSDGTAIDSQRYIDTHGIRNITVFQSKANNNLGGTHKIAFDYAIEFSYDYVGILHGDDQADPNDLLTMINKISLSKTETSLLGSRFSRRSNLVGYSFLRILGNVVLNGLYSLRHRKILTDLGSGLNIFKISDLKETPYHAFSNSLVFNYQLIHHFSLNKITFQYEPITWTDSDQKSNANNFRIFWNGVKILFSKTHSGQLGNSLRPFKERVTNVAAE